MRKWGATGILITILLILTLLGAVNYFTTPFKKWQMTKEEERVDLPQITDDTQDKNEDLPIRLVDTLTDSELVWQVLAVPVEVDNRQIKANWQNTDRLAKRGLEEVESIVNSEIRAATVSGELTQLNDQTLSNRDLLIDLPATAPGSLVIFGNQISTISATQFSQSVENIYASDSAKPWIAVDHEGGTVQRLNGQGFTILPSWQKVCQSSPSAQINYADQTSQELKKAGIDLVLAPVIDVATRSAVMGSRICSGDPDKVASVSATFINSYLQANMLPVVKHYPGIGNVTVDLHNQFGATAVQSADVKPFHTLLNQFPLIGVMTSHIGPEKDSSEVCSRSYACVSELTGLYPKALVVSDALDMKAALYNSETKNVDTPLPQVALEALLAGNDLLLFGPTVSLDEIKNVAAYFLFAADKDPAVKERLDLAAEKILGYKEIYNN